MLTADFDKADGLWSMTAVDYMISGRIDNFRGTDGVYLGDDTQADPNDPHGRRERLGRRCCEAAFKCGRYGGNYCGNQDHSGSADGVSWTGMWNGQLFGPSTDAEADPIAPSGVAGQFWAETTDPDNMSASVGTQSRPSSARSARQRMSNS